MTELKQQILSLREQGKSYRQIQAILDCSKGTIAYHLGAGQAQKTRDRTNRSRTLLKRELDEYKESVGCADCKERYPHYVLQFDHLPEFIKIDNPAQLYHKYNKERAWEEVRKCEVVCANCHCIRTHTRGQNKRTDYDYTRID